MMISKIKLIAWDFDGTLYKLNPVIWDDIFSAQYRVIMNHTGWNIHKTKEEHAKIYKILTQSSTDTVARICGISIIQALMETEEYYDRSKYVSRDERLIDMFKILNTFRHVMFVNGKRSREEPVLQKLGLDPSIFETWITPEETGVVKPDPKSVDAIIRYSGLLPENHLVVGDREHVDLAPAHAAGMNTCLVWSVRPGDISDVTLDTVYKLSDILIS